MSATRPNLTQRNLGEVLELMRLLWALDHALQSSSKRMYGALGVTGPQRLVIRVVGKYPGISAKEVAGILHLHKSTLTGVLERLVSRNLLSRRPAEDDARRAELTLTDRGRLLDQVQTGTVEAAVRRALKRLSESEQAGARQLLSTLAAELDGDLRRAARPSGSRRGTRARRRPRR